METAGQSHAVSMVTVAVLKNEHRSAGNLHLCGPRSLGKDAYRYFEPLYVRDELLPAADEYEMLEETTPSGLRGRHRCARCGSL